jgi:predicted HTH domain antitoxin
MAGIVDERNLIRQKIVSMVKAAELRAGSRSELARVLNVRPQTVHSWLNSSAPDDANLLRLEEFLDDD